MSSLKKKEKNGRKNKSRFIYIGSFLLLVLGTGIISLKQFNIYFAKKQEEDKIRNFIELEKNNAPENETLNTNNMSSDNEDYIAMLEIPKIHFKKGLYSQNSKNNTIAKNIEILKGSNMPDVEDSTLFIAGHSGSGNLAFFNDLDKLEKNDLIYLYYNNIKYIYSVSNIERQDKTGNITYKKVKHTTDLVLTTCDQKNKNKQIVVITKLDNKESY